MMKLVRAASRLVPTVLPDQPYQVGLFCLFGFFLLLNHSLVMVVDIQEFRGRVESLDRLPQNHGLMISRPLGPLYHGR